MLKLNFLLRGFIFVLFCLSANVLHSQEFRTVGKTFFYDKPNGTPVLFLYDSIDNISLINQIDNWQSFEFYGIKARSIDLKKYILQKNSLLYDSKNKIVGQTLKDIKLREFNFELNKDTISLYGALEVFVERNKIRETSIDELSKRPDAFFSLKGTTEIVFNGKYDSTESVRYCKKIETNYSTFSFITDSDNWETDLIKKVIKSYGADVSEKPDNYIDITVYKKLSLKDTFSFSRTANDIRINEVHSGFYIWEVLHYGCCEDPNIITLETFNPQKTILKSKDEYYKMEGFNCQDDILLGYVNEYGSGIDSNIIGKVSYSIDGEHAKYVYIKVRNKNYVETVQHGYVEVNFKKLDEKKDYTQDYEDQNFKKIVYNNLGGVKSFKEAKGVGLVLTYVFWPDREKEPTKKKINIVFNNGIAEQKEIYLDFTP